MKNLDIGTLLVSKPFILDSYFKRSVILISEMGPAGSVGFILNKPTDLSLNDALDDFPKLDLPLYFGGPVQTDVIHFIHTMKNLSGAREIIKGIYWGGDLEELKMYIVKGLIKPNTLRFFAGYSGWEPGQIEAEEHKTWYLADGTNTLILPKQEDAQELWGTVLKTMGNSESILANFPDDPSLN